MQAKNTAQRDQRCYIVGDGVTTNEPVIDGYNRSLYSPQYTIANWDLPRRAKLASTAEFDEDAL